MLLDVHQGAATSFDQEIVALDETGAAASGGAAAGGAAPLCRLGKLQRRIVVTPNLDEKFSAWLERIMPRPFYYATSSPEGDGSANILSRGAT